MYWTAMARSVNYKVTTIAPNYFRGYKYYSSANLRPHIAIDPEAFDKENRSDGNKRVDYSHFINDFEGRRQPSLVRELNKLHSQKTSGTITLAGGLPNSETFPFKDIKMRLKDEQEITLEGKDLCDSLQYMPTQGYPPLLDWVRNFQKIVHSPPNWDNYDILVTPGSQDGLSKAIEMILEKGEPIILQHPVYSGTECVVKPFEADIIAIEQDKDGLRPDLLKQALEERMAPSDGFLKTKGIPKVIYVNTTGANPTGVALSFERKQEIYRIACEYNLIILEDDPYYYLHFQEEYPTSFLSMDTEGRVLRFDSFSKIVSPGLRVGFVTGPKQLIRRMELHLQASSLHASSFSQVIIHKVLETWGLDGFFKRASVTQQFYKTRRDAMVNAANKYLKGLAEWNEPTAGMFLWLRVLGLDDVRSLVMEECMQRGVILVTGHAYIVTADSPCQYLRACYSVATIPEIEEGIARLADAIRTELKKKSLAAKINLARASVKRDNEDDLLTATNHKNTLKIPQAMSEKALRGPLRGLCGPLGT